MPTSTTSGAAFSEIVCEFNPCWIIWIKQQYPLLILRYSMKSLEGTESVLGVHGDGICVMVVVVGSGAAVTMSVFLAQFLSDRMPSCIQQSFDVMEQDDVLGMKRIGLGEQ